MDIFLNILRLLWMEIEDMQRVKKRKPYQGIKKGLKLSKNVYCIVWKWESNSPLFMHFQYKTSTENKNKYNFLCN